MPNVNKENKQKVKAAKKYAGDMNKEKKRGFLPWLIIPLIIALIVIACSVYYCGKSYDLYANSKAEVEIPGLGDGFIPQGMCNFDTGNAMLVSGYMNNANQKSRIYYVDKETGASKYFTLPTDANNVAFGHFGGIAMSGHFVYLVTDGLVLQFKDTDFTLPETSGEISYSSFFNANINTDFCYATESALYVGEFYLEGKYNTDASHHITSPSGEVNHALAFVYTLDPAMPNGLASTAPTKAYSIPDKVQGMCITASGKFVFSTSYGLADSNLIVYNVFSQVGSGITLGGNHCELYFFEPDTFLKTIVAPSMSEGIDYHDGRIYVAFESASVKYKLFTRTREKYILSFEEF